jgi:lipid-A-disaccharide synthase
MTPAVPLKIGLLAGEASGDQLGASLMAALRSQVATPIEFRGVAGPAMQAQGMTSLFPLSDIAVMGFLPVLRHLPTLIARIRRCVDAIVAAPPDVLVLIDSPDFTHAVARRVRKRLPQLPIVDYVSPSVWAWRPGRARGMRRYVDHVLALLPFEPDAHRRLGGPACTYVGHPLIERLAELRPAEGEAARAAPVLLVLPGSRRAEIEALMPTFGTVGGAIAAIVPGLSIVLPAVDSQAARIERLAATWPCRPTVVRGEAAKFAAFRRARVALAASGTVTLELALSGVPMVVAYRVPKLEAALARRLIQVPSIVLPNLILGEAAIPEMVQDDCVPEKLMAALLALLASGTERERQVAALQRLDARMRLGGSLTPSALAARVVLSYVPALRSTLADR